MQKQFHLIKQQTVTKLSYYPAMMLYAIGSLLKQLDFFDDVCYLNNNNNINDYVSRLLRNYRTFRSYTQGIKQFFSASNVVFTYKISGRKEVLFSPVCNF